MEVPKNSANGLWIMDTMDKNCAAPAWLIFKEWMIRWIQDALWVHAQCSMLQTDGWILNILCLLPISRSKPSWCYFFLNISFPSAKKAFMQELAQCSMHLREVHFRTHGKKNKLLGWFSGVWFSIFAKNSLNKRRNLNRTEGLEAKGKNGIVKM